MLDCGVSHQGDVAEQYGGSHQWGGAVFSKPEAGGAGPCVEVLITQRFCFWCPLYSVHTRTCKHVVMGEMPIPAYPMHIVGEDLTVPLTKTDNNSLFILLITCLGGLTLMPFQAKLMGVSGNVCLSC